jgi:type IV pilus assembly protein PilN
MRFTINLATRTLLDQRWVTRTFALAVVVLATLLAWNFLRFSWNLGEMRRFDAETASAEKRLKSAPPGISAADHARITAGMTFFNEIIKRKTFGWIAFLEKLENATPDGVAVTLLSPDKAKGIIEIQGRARNFRDLEVYLDKLEESGNFHDILLLSHKNEVLWEQANGLKFSISCRVKEL